MRIENNEPNMSANNFDSDLSVSCWTPNDNSVNADVTPSSSKWLPPFGFSQQYVGTDKVQSPTEGKQPTTDQPEKPADSSREADFKRAFKAMSDKMHLGERVKYISSMLVAGESHNPGKPSYPHQDQLSATFRGLNRAGFTNKQIVDEINSQLERRNSSFRLNLEKDGAVMKLSVRNNDKVVLPAESIITDDDAFAIDNERVDKIAKECAAEFNKGNHDGKQFAELVKDAIKNGMTYSDFLSKVDSHLRRGRGDYSELMQTGEGMFLLKHKDGQSHVWIRPVESRK